MSEMKDIYGQELSVGGSIVYSDSSLRTINTGKITGFTEKRVKVELYHINKYSKDLRTHYDTVVTPDKLVAVSGFKEPVVALGPLLSEQELLDAKYLTSGGMKCPYCGKTDIDINGKGNFEGTVMYQSVSCTSCSEEWDDVYSLKGFSPIQGEENGV